MARVTLELPAPATIADIERFLQLLEAVGIPRDAEETILSSTRISPVTLSASIHVGDIALPTDTFDDDEEAGE